jgi:hypothetical protein
MPISQLPSRASPVCHARPAEALGAKFQTTDEITVRKRPLGLFGIDLRIVDDPELHGIDAELLGHLVHGDFERHQTRRFARCTHGVAFGQIERRQPHRRHAVGTGIKQPRLHDGGLRLAAGKVARPALMRDRRDLAVALGADANALDGRRAVRGVVHQKRAGQARL